MPNIDFLVIGAQKAGTTSLFEYLRRHPQIHMPAEKEIGFFNVDRNYRRGMEWYLTTVSRGAPADTICGEVSTYYMSGAPFGGMVQNGGQHSEPLEDVIPSRIQQCLPNARLICVLRDPVTRAYSHYRMMVLERVESRPFDDAIEELLEPNAMERARMAPTSNNGYIVNGEYARVLAGFLRCFKREQLMTIFSDELARRPAETLAAAFEFVGVPADFLPDNLDARYRTAAVKQRIPKLNLYAGQANLARVRPARMMWHALPDPVRRGVDRAYSVASYNVGMWNARRGIVGDDMTPSARERLIAHFRPDSEALGNMLGTDIPWLGSWGGS